MGNKTDGVIKEEGGNWEKGLSASKDGNVPKWMRIQSIPCQTKNGKHFARGPLEYGKREEIRIWKEGHLKRGGGEGGTWGIGAGRVATRVRKGFITGMRWWWWGILPEGKENVEEGG